MDAIIQVDNLKKQYGEHQVLKGISLTIHKGEIFALLGVNGAGKTTMLECMEGLRPYDEGTIQIQGKFGVQLQSASIPKDMKGLEAITLFAKWQNTEIDHAYLKRLGVTPFLHERYGVLSTGQKRRIHLALALLGDPDIIFLDEPTAGLDVEGQAAIHQEIKDLKQLGKTIVLASHDMAEVESLCDRIAMIKSGVVVFCGTAEEFTASANRQLRLLIRFSKPFQGTNVLQPIRMEKDYYLFDTDSLENTIVDVITCSKQQGNTMLDIRVERADLTKRFLEFAEEKRS